MTALMNIGCGTVCHPDWINLDIHPSGSHVRRWDAKERLPCGNGEIDACYASHVIEHLHPADAEGLLRQCHRVLKDRGIIRIVVPDLEGLAREYVSVLDRIDRGDPQAPADHEWIVMELLDQMVRARSGGEMLRYLISGTVPNEMYVKSRIGADAEDMITRGPASTESHPSAIQRGVGRWLRDAVSEAENPRNLITRVVRYAREELSILLCGALLGRNGIVAIREALFRTSGECHRWMYDRISLQLLLERSGFSQVRVCTAFESQIEGFALYGLDVVKGRIRKPDSLFMEAVKQRSSA
jgi:predicted SAM-dependent methyltransferase